MVHQWSMLPSPTVELYDLACSGFANILQKLLDGQKKNKI